MPFWRHISTHLLHKHNDSIKWMLISSKMCWDTFFLFDQFEVLFMTVWVTYESTIDISISISSFVSFTVSMAISVKEWLYYIILFIKLETKLNWGPWKMQQWVLFLVFPNKQSMPAIITLLFILTLKGNWKAWSWHYAINSTTAHAVSK